MLLKKMQKVERKNNMKIMRDGKEYELTSEELAAANAEFVTNFMKSELMGRCEISDEELAEELAEQAYDRYCEGNGETGLIQNVFFNTLFKPIDHIRYWQLKKYGFSEFTFLTLGNIKLEISISTISSLMTNSSTSGNCLKIFLNLILRLNLFLSALGPDKTILRIPDSTSISTMSVIMLSAKYKYTPFTGEYETKF